MGLNHFPIQAMGLNLARPTYKAPRLAAQAQNHQFQIFPAPVLGLDASLPFTDQDPRAATVLENAIVRRSGDELRGGYRRHNSNLGGVGTESPVVALMAYLPPRGIGSAFLARLFAACENSNVYDVSDVTDESTVLSPSLAAVGQVEPGHFSWINFATANTNYLCAVSAGAGYFTFDHTGGWIDRNAAMSGTSSLDFDFVMAWKNRLWFIKENSTQAWYLPVGSITGALVMFDFGPLLTHGGELRAMASWTVDGGDGIDDRLVIVGAAGDVLIYGGTDPTSLSTFGLIGRWFVGAPPAGRRFMSNYGGDLNLLCETGIEYMSRVIQGRGNKDPEQPANTPSLRYNEVIAATVRATRLLPGWNMVQVPSLESTIVVTPYEEKISGVQFCYSTLPTAWSTFKGMPVKCAEVFDGDMFFGTRYGTVCRGFSADTDDELTTGTAGTDVTASVQTSFVSPSENKMQQKIPQLIMPMFQATQAPSIRARVNSEWRGDDVEGSPAFAPDTGSLWDVGLWDQAIWGGAVNTYFAWLGATGLGSYFSLRLQFKGKRGTIFTSWKFVFSLGGIM